MMAAKSAIKLSRDLTVNSALLIMHIMVVGYWLGAELVINSTFRLVSCSSGLPLQERHRLMDHVMNVDQHVRYALILQLGSGALLASILGYIPELRGLTVTITLSAILWLALVEVTHRQRRGKFAVRLAQLDRGLRYVIMLLLIVTGVAALVGDLRIVNWVAIKLVLFAGIMLCGVGIRFELMTYFAAFSKLGSQEDEAVNEAQLRRSYKRATGILGILWLQIIVIVFLSIGKPI